MQCRDGAKRVVWAAPLLCIGLAAGVFSCAVAVAVEEKPGQEEPEEAVFELREVSALDKGDSLTVGEFAKCTSEPDKAVKAYPKLKSKRPLYGKVAFDEDFFRQGSGIVYQFALDESGEAPPREEKKQEKNTEQKQLEKSLLQTLAEKLFGAVGKTKASDELPQAKRVPSRYDRLYFDANRDLDLTNDPVLKPMNNPPWQALPHWEGWEVEEKTAFEYLHIGFDYGPALGVRPFRILPWFTLSHEDTKNSTTMHFVATLAHEGRIRMGKHEYDALLAQAYIIAGRFDRPTTYLFLTPRNAPGNAKQRSESSVLREMHLVDDRLYRISSTPTGDQLVVTPYRGDFGVLRVGPGGRDIHGFKVRGSLENQWAEVPVGAYSPGSRSVEAAEECRVPVGNYAVEILQVEFGPLEVTIMWNGHSEGHRRDRQGKPVVSGFKIRKDQPFVLDFSHKPEVIFTSPSREGAFKPGDEVEVSAYLTDPVLDFVFRTIINTRKKQKITYKTGDGKEESDERLLSLDPVVTITDSSGKTVAEGTMPFG